MNCQIWMTEYLERQRELLTALPLPEIEALISLLRATAELNRTIFVVGNGGNAANAAHFATDLGKGASDSGPDRFRVMSLADNVPWMTALGNDYSFADVFVRQLMNFARPGDLLLASSVSGNSPNLVNAVEWANAHELVTIGLVGGARGQLATLVRHPIIVDDTHYGRVEDAQMTILHMLCYAFMESVTIANRDAGEA